MEKQQSVSELVAKLAKGSTYEMLDAAEGLGRVGEPAVLAVAPLLRSVHRETRWRGRSPSSGSARLRSRP